MILPPGVTLQQIDGGPSYYASNGFTYAASPDATMTAAGALGWDDPAMFPIGLFYAFYPANSMTVFKQLGLNMANVVTSDTDMTVLHAAGVWAVIQSGASAGGTYPASYGNETCGWHIEEPTSWNTGGDTQSIVNQVTNCGVLTGRFLQTALTSQQLNYPLFSSKPYTDAPGDGTIQAVWGTPISTAYGNRTLNIPGLDQYMFADQAITSAQENINGIETGTFSACTPAQAARGSNYGDLIDLMRQWVPGTDGTTPAPVISAYIENDDALEGGSGGVVIKPAQMNWAVWSTLVHGARGILYFATASDDGNTSTFGFSTSVQSGETISNFTQAVNTNALVTAAAKILNSQFALGYVTASPAAYSFPVPLVTMTGTRNGWGATGIDVMAKAFNGPAYTAGGITWKPGFYIFATYRGPYTDAGIAVTFTVAGSYSGPVAVINADGGGASYAGASAVTATAGSFSDTFTKASSVRIYQIPAVASGGIYPGPMGHGEVLSPYA